MTGRCMDVGIWPWWLEKKTILSDMHRRRCVDSRGASRVGIVFPYRSVSVSISACGVEGCHLVIWTYRAVEFLLEVNLTRLPPLGHVESLCLGVSSFLSRVALRLYSSATV